MTPGNGRWRWIEGISSNVTGGGREGGEEGRGGVWLQSHEGDVSTCHIVVITCATVAARLVVVTLIGRGCGRDHRGRRDCGSCNEDERHIQFQV